LFRSGPGTFVRGGILTRCATALLIRLLSSSLFASARLVSLPLAARIGLALAMCWRVRPVGIGRRFVGAWFMSLISFPQRSLGIRCALRLFLAAGACRAFFIGRTAIGRLWLFA
jgi:hypothetical protein